MLSETSSSQTPRSSSRRLIVALCVGAAAAFLILRLAPFIRDTFEPRYRLGEQVHNLALARKYAETLQPVIAADPRFRDIRLEPYTGDGGSLAVSGNVSREEDLRELRRIVMAHQPPVPVSFTDVFLQQPTP